MRLRSQRVYTRVSQGSCQYDGRTGTSNARLYTYREELVIFMHRVALGVLLAHHYARRGNEKVDDGDMAKNAD